MEQTGILVIFYGVEGDKSILHDELCKQGSQGWGYRDNLKTLNKATTILTQRDSHLKAQVVRLELSQSHGEAFGKRKSVMARRAKAILICDAS